MNVVHRGQKRLASNDGRIRWNHGDGSFRLNTKALAVLPSELGGQPQDLRIALETLTTPSGGTIYLRNGTYLPDSDLIIPDNVAFIGETPGAAVIDFQAQRYQIVAQGANAYTTGSIAVTNRSTTVTGSGTNWDSTMIGQTLIINGVYYAILDVGSATSLTIDVPYEITTATGQTYAIADALFNVTLDSFSVQNSTHEDGAVFFKYVAGGNIGTVNVYDSVIGFNYLHCSTVNASGFSAIGNTTGVKARYAGSWTFGDYFILNNGVNMSLFNMVACSIHNATNSSSSGNGLTLDTCRAIGFYDHTLTSNEGHGIEIINSSDIETFASNIQYSGGDGIRLSSGNVRVGVQNVTLQGNTGWGVNITNSTNIKNSLVMNFYSGNGSGTLNDSGTSTISANNQT